MLMNSVDSINIRFFNDYQIIFSFCRYNLFLNKMDEVIWQKELNIEYTNQLLCKKSSGVLDIRTSIKIRRCALAVKKMN